MVNLVIVSHSAQLGQGVGELARQMLRGDGCRLAIAAGIDDPVNPIGTDPIKVMEAIESVADTDHVLVMMDMGSALLSAETALELLDPVIAQKVRLCAAPLVEGTLAATVSAAAGAGIEKVIMDAQNSLQAKRVQLGLPAEEATVPTLASNESLGGEALSATVVINNPHGLHVRPAAQLVSALAGFNAHLVLEKDGKCVKPDSINQIALLQVRYQDTLRLIAKGPEATEALVAFKTLAVENFGEDLATQPSRQQSTADVVTVSGEVLRYSPVNFALRESASNSADEEARRLKMAISHTLDDLNSLTQLAAEKYSDDIAAIFSGHHTLLDDAELIDSACELLRTHGYSAEWAWHTVMADLSAQYRQLDDAYLQARYIDVDDILQRVLGHLTQTTERHPQHQRPTIIIADDIYPSVVLQLDTRKVAGISLKEGSALSHSAIIAREAGIPFLCQQGDALQNFCSGDLLTLENVPVRS